MRKVLSAFLLFFLYYSGLPRLFPVKEAAGQPERNTQAIQTRKFGSTLQLTSITVQARAGIDDQIR
jgi:hypothetical protein